MSLLKLGRSYLQQNHILTKFFNPLTIKTRSLNCHGETRELTGLILGVYTKDDDPSGKIKTYTKTAEEFDISVNGKLTEELNMTGPIPRLGEVKVFYRLEKMYTAVAVTGLGEECKTYNEAEQLDEAKEAIRIATGLGARILQTHHMRYTEIESMGHAESAAEGAAMGVWMYQELRKQQKSIPKLDLYSSCDFTGWQIGLQKAAAQNLARQLSETPANMLTPIGFAQAAVEILAKSGVSVEVKVKDWADIMNMQAYISAAKGSCEPPVFLELHYYGCEPDVAPVVLIGKGATFDSGGLCLKSCEVQKDMRGDMSGAASVVAAARAVAALKLPINLRGLIPLYENMPGSCAMKSGDIVRSRSGKTVLITDTDYDGRLTIADALSYAGTYNPKFILTVGSFTKELIDCFGEGVIPTFSNNDSLYETMKIASIHTGDRVWRLPLWNHYTNKVQLTPFADINDKLEDTSLSERMVDFGVPGQAAAFLYEFNPGRTDWIHLDIFNVLTTDGKIQPYLLPGMSGRPTRTIIEFLAQLACLTDESVVEDNTAMEQMKCAPI